MAVEEHIEFGHGSSGVTTGTAGLRSQVPGAAATVGALAAASGGIGAGRLVETAIGKKLSEKRKN